MLQRIKFTANGCSTLFGNFAAGDVANIDDAVARHLVEQAAVARYVDAAPVVAPVVDVAHESPAMAPKKGKAATK